MHKTSGGLPRRRLLLGMAAGTAGLVATAMAMLLAASGASAQAIASSRPIRLVVPFAAGASTDSLARMVAQSMTRTLGQTVIVDNKAGAGGMLAAGEVAKSAPDGTTFMLVSAGIVTTNQSIYKKLPYDPIKDFTPLIIAVRMPLILIVNPTQPLRGVSDYLAAAKAKPGMVTYGSSGPGTSMHLAGALFESTAGISLLHVPYKGGAPAMTDLMGNQITSMFVNAPSGLAQIRTGKVRALAVGSSQRMPQLPDVPTLAESGLAGYNSDTWYGFMMPAGAAPEVAAKLQGAITAALAENKVKLEHEGYTVDGADGAAMAVRIRDESIKWATVIRASGIKLQ